MRLIEVAVCDHGGILAIKTFIAFGCVHIPHHDKEHAAWIISQIKERKPQVVVCLGDLIDAESVSVYPKVDPVKLSAEYEAAAEFMELVGDAAPKTTKIFMQGNHEERIFRPDQSDVFNLIDYRKHIKQFKRWKHYEYIFDEAHTYNLGQLVFAHGWGYTKTGRTEDFEGMDLGGRISYRCYVHAHTHRPSMGQMRSGSDKLEYYRCNVGCGIDFDWVKRGYAKKRNISMWQHALAWGWAETKRRADSKCNWGIELLRGKKAWEV